MSSVPFQVTVSTLSGPKPQDLHPNSWMGGMYLNISFNSYFKKLTHLLELVCEVVWWIFSFMDGEMQLFEWKIAVETLPMLFALVPHRRAVKRRRELEQGGQ
jgi:hypothetical protein